MTSYEIAKAAGCSYATVLAALRQFGIPIKSGGTRKGKALAPRRRLDIDEIRRLYVDELWSSKALAVHFGCSSPTILQRLHSVGVAVRHHNDTKRGRTNHLRLPLDGGAIVAMYLSGANPSYEEIGAAFGVRGRTIRKRLIEHGVVLRTMSETIAGKRTGRLNSNWREDLSPEERGRRRDMAAIAKWRAKVYARDGYACQRCGDARGKNLNAHHVESHCTNKKGELCS